MPPAALPDAIPSEFGFGTAPTGQSTGRSANRCAAVSRAPVQRQPERPGRHRHKASHVADQVSPRGVRVPSATCGTTKPSATSRNGRPSPTCWGTRDVRRSPKRPRWNGTRTSATATIDQSHPEPDGGRWTSSDQHIANDQEFRGNLQVKWSFNIKPDLVIQTASDQAVVIEALGTSPA